MADTVTPSGTIAPGFDKYVNQMLGLGAGFGSVENGFLPFNGERFAGPSDLQTQAFNGIAGLQTPGQYGQATNAYQDVLNRAGGIGGYATGQFNPQQLQNFQMQAPSNVSAGGQNLQQYQMAGPERIGTQDFTQQGVADKFMSPYVGQVISNQQRDAQRQADIATTQRNAQAVGAGAFGGSRQAITDAEAQKNLAQQKGDIYATGMQNAFGSAQQQFNAQQQAALQAAQANQTAGLNTNVQNLAAKLGVQQLGSGQDLQAQMANQNAGLNTNQQNLAALLGIQQLGAGQNLQAQQMAEQSRQFGANYGLSGLNAMNTAAGGLSTTGAYQGASNNQWYNNMLNAGGIQQGLNQQPMDFGYQQWSQALNYPMYQASSMSSLLSGLPVSAKDYTAGTTPGASALQGGLAGLYTYNMATQAPKVG